MAEQREDVGSADSVHDQLDWIAVKGSLLCACAAGACVPGVDAAWVEEGRAAEYLWRGYSCRFDHAGPAGAAGAVFAGRGDLHSTEQPAVGRRKCGERENCGCGACPK